MQYKFEDIKGIIRSRTSKNDRECNHHKKKDKRINNDLPTLQRKLKIVPLTPKVNSCAPEGQAVTASLVTRRATQDTNRVISYE